MRFLCVLALAFAVTAIRAEEYVGLNDITASPESASLDTDDIADLDE